MIKCSTIVVQITLKDFKVFMQINTQMRIINMGVSQKSPHRAISFVFFGDAVLDDRLREHTGITFRSI